MPAEWRLAVSDCSLLMVYAINITYICIWQWTMYNEWSSLIFKRIFCITSFYAMMLKIPVLLPIFFWPKNPSLHEMKLLNFNNNNNSYLHIPQQLSPISSRWMRAVGGAVFFYILAPKLLVLSVEAVVVAESWEPVSWLLFMQPVIVLIVEFSWVSNLPIWLI